MQRHLENDIVSRQRVFKGYLDHIRLGSNWQHNGYYAVEDVRAYAGADGILFSDTAISRATGEGCLEVFGQSVEAARRSSSSSGLDPRNPDDGMVDPALSAVRTAYRAEFADAFAIKLAHYRRPETHGHEGGQGFRAAFGRPSFHQYCQSSIEST